MTGHNRLADEPSPYLRQHADNPVHWWPWCDEAFDEARRRDVPVFLSIGYATCHWCHVMAHESFEDDGVAALLNDAFVCIKVDREERPDVDATYMAACQAMGQRGGWPLTAVLDNERRPWFVGTYFPKQGHGHGRMGMMELVPALQSAWTERRDDVEASAKDVLQHLERPPRMTETGRIDAQLLHQAVGDLKATFDPEEGGFGGAPKFPSPQQLLLLLRHHHRTGDPDALAMVGSTLDAMARGGLHDHVGGGFHRYSTDREWHLPHFEKMLYDQAMLLMAYTEGFQVTGNEEFQAVAEGIVGYVLRDLRHADGGFFCAEDADSDGEEGTFYVWSADELRAVLGKDALPFMEAYGCQEDGNFHDEATRQPVPANILHLQQEIPLTQHQASLAKLFATRVHRNRPLRDDKILADWNGLLVAALAKAGAVFDRSEWTEAAAAAARFVQEHMTANGNLRHRWHNGRLDDRSFLDDHAFQAWGLLELFQSTQEPVWLERAIEAAGTIRSRFQAEGGRLTLSPLDGEAMVVDATKAYDGAMPSGTSIAVLVLERLGRITGDTGWTDAAWQAVRNVDGLANHPSAFHALMCALPGLLGEGTEVVVTGNGPEATRMKNELRQSFHPDAVVLHVEGKTGGLPEWLADYDSTKDAAYVCRARICDAPVTDLQGLRQRLQV